jgi:hypothetical protein
LGPQTSSQMQFMAQDDLTILSVRMSLGLFAEVMILSALEAPSRIKPGSAPSGEFTKYCDAPRPELVEEKLQAVWQNLTTLLSVRPDTDGQTMSW